MHDRRQDQMQGMLHSQKKIKYQAGFEKKQTSFSVYRVFVVLCSVSRSIYSRIRSYVLFHNTSCSVTNYDSSLFGVVFLVTKPTIIGFKEKERLVHRFCCTNIAGFISFHKYSVFTNNRTAFFTSILSPFHKVEIGSYFFVGFFF